MEAVTLKRHKLKFYLTVILGSLAFIALGTVMLSTFISIQHRGVLKTKDKLMPFISIAIYVMAIYFTYKYYKNAPTVSVDKTSIRIDHTTYNWVDVASIELTGKQFFPFLFSYAMEATTIHLHNGQTKYLFDDMYENTWELKSFLKQVVIEEKEYVPEKYQHDDLLEAENEYFETFSGQQLTSFTGIMFWIVLVAMFFMLVMLDKSGNYLGAVIATLVFAFIWIAMHARFMHFFKLSETHLLVKNQHIFWKKRMYRLTSIHEITFEAPQITQLPAGNNERF